MRVTKAELTQECLNNREEIKRLHQIIADLKKNESKLLLAINDYGDALKKAHEETVELATLRGQIKALQAKKQWTASQLYLLRNSLKYVLREL